MKPREFLSHVERERVIRAIQSAEAGTSGEIRVYIERETPERDDPLEEARFHFAEIGMTNTRERNGVLIYIAPVPQKFAVVGDEGITRVVGNDYWLELVTAMRDEFHAGHFTDALVAAIGKMGAVLAQYFPRQADDVNELPDQLLEG